MAALKILDGDLQVSTNSYGVSLEILNNNGLDILLNLPTAAEYGVPLLNILRIVFIYHDSRIPQEFINKMINVGIAYLWQFDNKDRILSIKLSREAAIFIEKIIKKFPQKREKLDEIYRQRKQINLISTTRRISADNPSNDIVIAVDDVFFNVPEGFPDFPYHGFEVLAVLLTTIFEKRIDLNREDFINLVFKKRGDKRPSDESLTQSVEEALKDIFGIDLRSKGIKLELFDGNAECFEKLRKKYLSQTILVNRSLVRLKEHREIDRIGGSIDPKKVEELSTSNDVFMTVAAGNDSNPDIYTYPVMNNVAIIGATIAQNTEAKLAQFSNYGPHITASVPGLSLNDSGGTSFSSPIYLGILAANLLADRKLSIKGAVDEIHRRAKGDILDGGKFVYPLWWDKTTHGVDKAMLFSMFYGYVEQILFKQLLPKVSSGSRVAVNQAGLSDDDQLIYNRPSNILLQEQLESDRRAIEQRINESEKGDFTSLIVERLDTNYFKGVNVLGISEKVKAIEKPLYSNNPDEPRMINNFSVIEEFNNQHRPGAVPLVLIKGDRNRYLELDLRLYGYKTVLSLLDKDPLFIEKNRMLIIKAAEDTFRLEPERMFSHQDLHLQNILVKLDKSGNIEDIKFIDFKHMRKIEGENLENLRRWLSGDPAPFMNTEHPVNLQWRDLRNKKFGQYFGEREFMGSDLSGSTLTMRWGGFNFRYVNLTGVRVVHQIPDGKFSSNVDVKGANLEGFEINLQDGVVILRDGALNVPSYFEQHPASYDPAMSAITQSWNNPKFVQMRAVHQKKEVGGIDLTAERMDLEVETDNAQISVPLDLKELEKIEINALYIKDIEIKPLANLPELLGISG